MEKAKNAQCFGSLQKKYSRDKENCKKIVEIDTNSRISDRHKFRQVWSLDKNRQVWTRLAEFGKEYTSLDKF